MLTQEMFDAGASEVAPSRYIASAELWNLTRDCSFDPESFVPVDAKQHNLAHAVKGDTEFATSDKHGPLHGPIVDYLLKNAAPKVKTSQLGQVYLARRVIVPSRNLTVWVYPPESEHALRAYHATGMLA